MATKYLIAALLLLPTFVHADNDWSTSDTNRQTAYFVLHTIDWGQTLDIEDRCGDTDYYEKTPTLGTCPSRGEINRYFLSTGAAHYAISRALPPKWRRVWQHVTIGVELGTVSNNFSIGLGVSF